MDIGFFGAFVLLLVIGWLPVVIALLLFSVVAAVFTRSLMQQGSMRRWLARYFAIATVAFIPCQILFFRLAFYATNPSEMSGLMTSIYVLLGVLLFGLLSWQYR